jgi:hypothetical protein
LLPEPGELLRAQAHHLREFLAGLAAKDLLRGQDALLLGEALHLLPHPLEKLRGGEAL